VKAGWDGRLEGYVAQRDFTGTSDPGRGRVKLGQEQRWGGSDPISVRSY